MNTKEETKPVSKTTAKVDSQLCSRILQRTQGWSAQQAADYVAKLSDDDQAKLIATEKTPHHGNLVKQFLDDVADRQTVENKKE